ncbi:MAG: EAL domain-containing protein [Rhodospirillales bacterium]|nr:MAG: EAL domain-containing protein [Rhodospirillales bacterium]
MTRTRVLVVDDEPHVLAGFHRGLRHHFDIVTAASGPEGLDLLERQGPFAVVVSDMQMPGMDGVAFLNQVRTRAPEIMRIMLTGQGDLQTAMAAVNHGQVFRFLTKPCAQPNLVAAISDAAAEYCRHALVRRELVRLEAERRHISLVIDTLAEAVIGLDSVGCIVSCNQAVERLFGLGQTELAGQCLSRLIPDLDPRQLHVPASDGKVAALETEGCHRDGRRFPVELVLGADHEREDRAGTAIVRDISAERRAEEALHRNSSHDALTGVANGRVMRGRLLDALARDGERGQATGLAIVDLRQVGEINEAFGHDAGDAVLSETAERLKRNTSHPDQVARIGNTEFAILLPAVAGEDALRALLGGLVDVLAAPVPVDGHKIPCIASIGATLNTERHAPADRLWQEATLAARRARETPRTTFCLYHERQDGGVARRRDLERALASALDQGQLSLAYQPLIHLPSGEIAGFEALMRWTHPSLGTIPPDIFIPLAEANGLIIPLGEWALATAAAQTLCWQHEGLGEFRVAVNISAQQIGGGKLLATVRQALARSGLPPHALELEITERTAVQEGDDVIAELVRLDELGIRLAIDDFGTGYSSLRYLRQLPVHRLKIDRSFVRNLPDDGEDRAIVEAVLVLARSLKLEVIAEGVETPAQARLLAALGCREAQGYLFTPPLPPAQVPGWIAEHRRASATAESSGSASAFDAHAAERHDDGSPHDLDRREAGAARAHAGDRGT